MSVDGLFINLQTTVTDEPGWMKVKANVDVERHTAGLKKANKKVQKTKKALKRFRDKISRLRVCERESNVDMTLSINSAIFCASRILY